MPLSTIAVEGQVMRVFVHHALAAAFRASRSATPSRAISGLRMVKTGAEVAALEERDPHLRGRARRGDRMPSASA